jgi:hypothetical protein
MAGVVPPIRGGLHVDGVRLHLFQQKFGAVGEGRGGVGGSDEGEGALSGGVCEGGEGVGEGAVPVGDAVVDVAVEMGCAQETVDNS